MVRFDPVRSIKLSWCRSHVAVLILLEDRLCFFWYSLLIIRSSAESICPSVFISFPVNDFDVELCYVFCPSDLSLVQHFCRNEVHEVFVIRVDCDWVLGSNEVMFPFFKCFDESYEFFAVNWVVGLWSVELLREIADKSEPSFLVSLSKLSADCVV